MDEQGTGSIFNVNNFPIFKIQYWTQLHQGGVPAFVGFNAGNGTKSYSYMPYSQVRRSRTVGHKFRWFWWSPVPFSDHLCSGPALHRDGQRVPRTPHIQDRREDLTWSLHQVGVKSRLETLQSGSGTWLEPTFPWSLLRRMGTCWVGGWNDKNDKSENDDNNDNDIIIQRWDDGQPYRALLWAWHAGYLQVSLSLQITFTFF